MDIPLNKDNYFLKHKERLRRKHLHRSKVTTQILFQYIFTLIAFVVIYIILLLIGWNFTSLFTWQADDPLYWVLHWIKEYIILFTGIVSFTGWAGITYYFISKPLRYLDEIVDASEQLAAPSDIPISLPSTLKNVQDELNLVREQALRNAYLAKEAEQRKNDLIIYLAHDLKTPLTSVIGYLTLLRDEPMISSALRARYTGIALDKAERLEELINEFFDITRFNLTTLTLDPEQIDLSRMLAQITSEFDPILAEKDLTLHTEIAPDVQILCDPDKLERVFDNLIRNAVNYSYAGTEIQFSMSLSGEQVTVALQNQGKTIQPDKLERIFDQFFRLDSSRSSATGGSGLGLAISKEIVELHGGSIRAESADEKITFTVLLPTDCHKFV